MNRQSDYDQDLRISLNAGRRLLNPGKLIPVVVYGQVKPPQIVAARACSLVQPFVGEADFRCHPADLRIRNISAGMCMIKNQLLQN